MNRWDGARLRALMLIVVVLAAGAPAYAGSADGYRSVWAGPWEPAVAEPEAQRFVALWAPRIRDEAWMEGYLQQRTFPAAVVSEGFHDEDRHTKMYLVDRLFEHIVRTDPVLRADATKILSAPTAGTDEQEAMLYRSIFEKDWRNAFADKIDSTSRLPVPNEPAPPTALQRSLEEARVVEPIDVPSFEVPDSMKLRPGRSVPFTSWLDGANLYGMRVAPTLPRRKRISADPGGPLSPLTYSACHQEGSAAAACDTDLPLGAPHAVDVTGDGIPDVVAVLTVDPLAQISSAGVNALALSFRVLKVAGGTPLPSHVFFSIDVPQAGKRIAAGFDGRASTLADDSSMTATVADLAQAIAGKLTLGLNVGHSNPGPRSALSFRAQDIAAAGAPGLNPVSGSLAFDPTPASFSGAVTMNRIVGADEYVVQLTSPQRPKLTATIVSERETAARREMQLVVDALPQNLTATINTPSSGDIGVVYSAAQPIDSLTFTDAQTPDTSMPGNVTMLQGQVQGIPSSVSLAVTTSNPLRLRYSASSSIPSAWVTSRRFANGAAPVDGSTQPVETLAAGLEGIPTSIDATADLVGRSIRWTADAPLGGLGFSARTLDGTRTVDAGLSITSIPAEWTLDFPGDSVTFNGVSGPIGLVSASLTNHGAFTTFPGNHASIVSNQSTGDLDASFAMAQINRVDVRPTPSGFTADLRMGGGGPFRAYASYLTNKVVSLDASLTPLPTSIQITQAGSDLSYTGDTNFDLSAQIAVGSALALAVTPTPPTPHGVAIRDGIRCILSFCSTALRANVLLRGCPTGLQVLTSQSTGPKIVITDFNPPSTSSSLTLDAVLDDIPSKDLSVLAVQSGIPSHVNFTLGPIATTTLGDGSRRTTMSYTSNKSLGQFSVDASMGTDTGRLVISNIPSSVSITVTAGSPNTTASISTSQSINSIDAFFRRVSDITFGAGLMLDQLPTSMNLTFGRISTSSGGDITAPGMSYSANASTLDIAAFVNASLFGGNLQAAASLGAVNLGASTNAFFSGGNLRLTSSPATSSLELHTWGRLNYLKSMQKCLPGCGDSIRFQVSGHAGVVPLVINDLMLRVTNFSDVTVRPGVTSGVSGAFGTFTFGWNSMTATIDFEVHVEVCFPGGGCPDILPPVVVHTTIPINVRFHIGGNHWQTGWIDFETGIVICDVGWFDATAYDIEVDINPHQHFSQVNSFTLGAPSSGEGSGWTVTPNPFGFSQGVMQVVAALTSPFPGSGFSFHLRCN